MNNMFIASPIAGFTSEADYNKYKKLIKSVVGKIKKNNNNLNNIFCEITNINDISEYDSPASAVTKDLYHIDESEIFVLLYPKKVVSSALIELGYAISKRKKILIIASSKDILPYMVLGLDQVYPNIKVEITEYTFENMFNLINKFIN